MTDPLLPTQTRWKKLALSDAESLSLAKDASGQIRKLTGIVDSVSSAIKASIDLAAKLALSGLDPAILALKAVIEAARKALEDLTGEGGTGIYEIVIPVNPIDAYLPASIPFSQKPGSDWSEAQKIASYVDQANLGKRGNAGNYGFFGKLQESLRDENDLLRPRFDESAYVAGVVIIFGSTSPVRLLQLIQKLVALFGNVPSPSAFSEAWSEAFGPSLGLPKARGLRAEIVPKVQIDLENGAAVANLDTESESPIGVRIEWDPLPSQYFSSAFPNSNQSGLLKWKVTGLKIFASSDGTLISLANPTAMEDLLVYENNEYNGWTTISYIEGLEPGRTYQIGVGFEVQEVVSPAGSGEDEELADDRILFSIAQTSVAIPSTGEFFNRQGVPPNWQAIPSPLAMIPALRKIAQEMIDFLTDLEKLLESASDKLEKFVTQLKKTIDGYVDWAKSLADTLIQILDALDFPDVYSGYMTFSGQGGNALMLNRIGSSLFGTDSKAPPFNQGTEPVLGTVIMAGSGTLGAIRNFQQAMELIFATSFSDTTDAWESTKNAWLEAEESIDALADDVTRQIQFQDDMIAQISYSNDSVESGELIRVDGTLQSDLQRVEPELRAFGLDMTPSKEGVGCD